MELVQGNAFWRALPWSLMTNERLTSPKSQPYLDSSQRTKLLHARLATCVVRICPRSKFPSSMLSMSISASQPAKAAGRYYRLNLEQQVCDGGHTKRPPRFLNLWNRPCKEGASLRRRACVVHNMERKPAQGVSGKWKVRCRDAFKAVGCDGTCTSNASSSLNIASAMNGGMHLPPLSLF